MTTITLRVAHRQRGDTVIQGTDAHAAYFNLGEFFDISYRDKQLILKKDPKGSSHCAVPSAYKRKGYTRSFSKKCLDAWIPGFAVDTADFEIVEGALIWARPPLWTLPWTMHPPTENQREYALDGFLKRLKSCKRNNGDPQFVTQAASRSWAKTTLSGGEWMQLVRSVYPS